MLTAPPSPSDTEVLAAVRTHWATDAAAAVYLPVGSGAHQWGTDDGSGPVLFATVDADTELRPLAEAAAAYGAAAHLQAAGVRGVVAPVPSSAGTAVVQLDGAGLSVTPWLRGTTPSEHEARAHATETAELLRGLHAARGDGVPRWRTRVRPGLADAIAEATAGPWRSGPFGEPARRAIRSRLAEILTWTGRHAALVERALAVEWVPTHGEPHHPNQLRTPAGLVLVDWESLRLAPPERDHLDLPSDLHREVGSRDWAVELFEWEWRLTEIDEYLEWFRRPHSGGPDDEAAFVGLQEELNIA
ncbi:hypothetical protein GCM10009551_087280 [Nocardiopsis tropica]